MSVPHDVAQEIVAAGRRMDALGWVPATAGNFSVRLDAQRIAITASGRHKGFLTPEDVMGVDAEGVPLHAGQKASAETLLHCGIYRRFPEAGAVLHGHSIANTVLSRQGANALRLAGYELLKAFPGLPTHEAAVRLPILDNDQDIARLAAKVQPWLDEHPDCVGYLIRGHGLYTWGATMSDCLRQVEAFEFLFECELKVRALQR